MLYIRRLFKQDLRKGKQIAFPKEASTKFFEFDYSNPDPERNISFKYTDPETDKDGKVIHTRIYAAGSESRIDGELKQFLRDELNAEIDDMIVFKSKNNQSFTFEFIKKDSPSFNVYKNIIGGKNHEVIINESEDINSQTKNINDFLEDFTDWFIDKDGIDTNYFKTQFSSSRERLIKELEEAEQIYEQEFGSKIFKIDEEDIESLIKRLENHLSKREGLFHEYSSGKSNHRPRAIIGKNNYIRFLREKLEEGKEISSESKKINVFSNQVELDISTFKDACSNAGLVYSDKLITRFVSSLLTKPFVILTGLSGSGKTKLAQSFVQWICQHNSQYCIVPVGADWTNREPLLGYVNALNPREYIKPENLALELIINANENPDLPYFMILDEMNLSHVERYFADFLSVMESNERFKLHSSDEALETGTGNVKKDYEWPENLFVIGTVNIDETTYMFSPKVLDRANVIEFRISENQIINFLNEPRGIKSLNGEGAKMAVNFVKHAKDKSTDTSLKLKDTLNDFFKELKKVGAEFGYRTAMEIQTLYAQIDKVDSGYSEKENEKIDIAIMQKLLPKLHGSRRKLVPVLTTLGNMCYEGNDVVKDVFDIEDGYDFDSSRFPLSLEKMSRMYKGVMDNGFVSYAEA